MSNTVSRVLYQTIIYLDLTLPPGSSNLPGTRRAAVLFLFGLASDGVYSRRLCYQRRGEPLPHLFTLTSTKLAVLFCCTSLRVASTGRYPASCPAKPGLSSPLHCRWILQPKTIQSRDHLLQLPYGFHTLKQLPPINSRTIELLGRCSVLTPRK